MELWVENRLGLHARPAAQISALAQQFRATLTLEKDGQEVDARQVLAILTLDSPMGARLVVRAVGPDAREAVTALARLFARKFGES
ncbi:MAG: HPr family phosphocarrier protein [Deltaproteobacteria bacterium]|nr:HPr family phosphocarrier protein [Deltaproteobacteria bacterium]